MSLDSILGNIINVVKNNPQLLTTVISALSPNQNTNQNTQNTNTSNQDDYANTENYNNSTTQIENLNDNNPYWALPQYHFEESNHKNKSNYHYAETKQMYQTQNENSYKQQKPPMYKQQDYSQSTYNQPQSNQPQYEQTQPTLPPNKNLDLNTIIKILSELLSAIKSQKSATAPAVNTQSYQTNSILSLRPTNNS